MPLYSSCPWPRRPPVALLLAWLILLAPATAAALPVAAEQLASPLSLKNFASYLCDPSARLGILDVGAPQRQSRFSPLESGPPLRGGGALWLRFSLVRNSLEDASPASGGGILLDLGRDSPAAALYTAESLSPDGEVRQWRIRAPRADGLFTLPEPGFLPMTVYARLENVPSLWFNPRLFRQPPGGPEEPGPSWRLLLSVALVLTSAILLAKAMLESAPWRGWGAAILACAAVFSFYAQAGTERLFLPLAAAPQLLAPGLALIILPHLGRRLLGSPPAPPVNAFLWLLSSLGAALALAPFVPGLGWTARLLPLYPLVFLPLLLLALPLAINKGGGAAAFFLFTFFPFAGALLALAGLRHGFLPWPDLGPRLSALGGFLGGVCLALWPPLRMEKADFFPLQNYLDASQLQADSPIELFREEKAAQTALFSDYAEDLLEDDRLDEILEEELKLPASNDAPDAAPTKEADGAPGAAATGEGPGARPGGLSSPAETDKAPDRFADPAFADVLEPAPDLRVPDAARSLASQERVIYVDAEEPGLIILKAPDKDPGKAFSRAEAEEGRLVEAQSPSAPPPLPEYILIADPAPSGRRSLARRLADLPCKLAEAGSGKEIIAACAGLDVGLIIIDADMPDADISAALQTVEKSGRRIPSLGLLAHASQSERMLRLGCSECLSGSVSRAELQESARRLSSRYSAKPLPQPVSAGQRVSMLDIIVHSLDAEAGVTQEGRERDQQGDEANGAASANGAARVDEAARVDGAARAHADAQRELELSLVELEEARLGAELEPLRAAASRIADQAEALGLASLEHVARYVEAAAGEEDEEAAGYLSEDLLNLGRRFLTGLKQG